MRKMFLGLYACSLASMALMTITASQASDVDARARLPMHQIMLGVHGTLEICDYEQCYVYAPAPEAFAVRASVSTELEAVRNGFALYQLKAVATTHTTFDDMMAMVDEYNEDADFSFYEQASEICLRADRPPYIPEAVCVTVQQPLTI